MGKYVFMFSGCVWSRVDGTAPSLRTDTHHGRPLIVSVLTCEGDYIMSSNPLEPQTLGWAVVPPTTWIGKVWTAAARKPDSQCQPKHFVVWYHWWIMLPLTLIEGAKKRPQHKTMWSKQETLQSVPTKAFLWLVGSTSDTTVQENVRNPKTMLRSLRWLHF